MSVNTTSHPLQSQAWGEFRKEWGNKIVRTDTDQVIFSKIPHTPWTIGTSLKGPMPTKKELQELREIGKKERAIFIKLEPNVVAHPLAHPRGVLGRHPGGVLEKHCVKGRPLFTPTTFLIDLTKSEDELLNSFSSKTRYNIRLAQKKGVEVTEDNSDKAFEKYLELMRETVQRQNFFAHSEKYHRLMWRHLKPSGIAHLLAGSYQGEIISIWILLISHRFYTTLMVLPLSSINRLWPIT